MPVYRAQVVLQAFTELPRDRYTNTWHFYSDLDHATVEANLDGSLETFYDAIGSNIPSYVSRTVTLNIYNLSDAPPRVPVTTQFTIPSGSATSLPGEVSVVLGFRAPLPHTPARRGRVYLGPLDDTVVTASTSSAFPQISSTFISTLSSAAAALAVNTAPLAPLSMPGSLGVWSPTLLTFTPITEFTIDDEFDTQRRRGYKTTTRTIVPAYS